MKLHNHAQAHQTPAAFRAPATRVTDLAAGSRAEFRSRLSWFIGVSDAGPADPFSLTYEPYFGLREKPFSLSSDPRFFFGDSTHGATFDRLAAGLRRREGIVVLTGEVGTGKTTLCRAVFQSLDQKTFAAFVPDPFLSREDLLKTLLVNFGVVSMDEIRRGRLRGVSRTDLSYPLYDFLASLQPLKASAVVMIDEAQNLTTELLEEIRILSDLENRQKLIQVLLVGQPELQWRLATPAMRQLSQRVAIRCELTPLPREDVKPYVSRRLTVAGNDGRVQFTDAAIDLVSTASSGTPRVINLVCDRALFRAAHSQTMKIDAEHVVWAVDDLKLPVARTLRVPLSGQTGDGLESFREEFLTPLIPFSDPVAHTPGGPALDTGWSPLPSSNADLGSQPDETRGSAFADLGSQPDETRGSAFADLGSQPDETRGSAFPEAAAPKPAIETDFAAARRRRNRLLSLVAACLAVASSLVVYGHSPAPASRRQSDVLAQPAEPRAHLRAAHGKAPDLSPKPEATPTGFSNPRSNRPGTKVSPGKTIPVVALQPEVAMRRDTYQQ